MPYPTEHAARVKDPDLFKRVRDITKAMREKGWEIPAGIRVLGGPLKGSGWSVQAWRFDATEWTAAEAKKWLKDNEHPYATFHEATGETSAADDGRDIALTGTVSITAAAAGERLPRLHIVAYTGVEMDLAGWFRPVVLHLDGLALPKVMPVLANHDLQKPIGHGTPAVQNGRLKVEGVVSAQDSDAGREFIASSKAGFPWQASIGAKATIVVEHGEGSEFEANGRQFKAGPKGLFEVKQARLREISLVAVGADEGTQVTVAAKGRLKDGGVDMPFSQEDVDKARREERERLDRIDAILAGVPAEKVASIRAKARKGELTIEAVQGAALEIMRSERPTPPAVWHGADSAVSRQVLAAAAVLTVAGDGAAKAYTPEVLEGAHRLRGLGIQELVAMAAGLEGITLPRFRADAGAWLHAAFSTIAVPGILSDVANKVLVDSFTSVEQTWRAVAKRSSVKDFKSSPRYRLTADLKYLQVGPGGELKHGTLGEETWAMKADTFGRILGIPRQMIIDDDLGAFGELPAGLGRGAGLGLNEVFWTIFLANGAFFTAGNKNYLTGADTALSIDGLTKAEQTVLDQVDDKGHPLGVQPKVLLVPTDLSAYAAQLMKSLELREPAAEQSYPVANPHAGKFEAAVSTYLKNAKFAGASAKAWYLLADPNVLPVIEVAFLDGRETPVIETAQADFDTLGIEMRGYHDFGVSLADPRGGVKAKGEA
jgi:hypothetical protein